jgi:hypothetical protein
MFRKRVALSIAAVAVMVAWAQPQAAMATGELVTFPAGKSVTVTGSQVSSFKLILTDHPLGGGETFWLIECKTAKLTGTAGAKTGDTSVTVHPTYEGCTSFGFAATVATTNCNYVYRLGEAIAGGWHAPTDISCSEGASIKITTANCEVTIGSQTGLTTSAVTNSGSASPETAMDLLIDVSISNFKYTVVKDGIGCPLSGTGSFSKGDFTGTATLQSDDQRGGGAVGLTARAAPTFIATGEQSGENTIQLTDHLIGGVPASVNCKAMTLTGTKALEAVKEELRVHPEYKECTAFGAAATVTTTNCDYLFHIGAATAGGWHTTTDVVCSGGSTIKVVSGNCEVTISGQTGLTTSELTNSGTEAEMDLLLHTAITGIHYTVVKDGTGCPLSGTGEFSQGDYTGTSTIKAHDAETLKQANITKT